MVPVVPVKTLVPSVESEMEGWRPVNAPTLPATRVARVGDREVVMIRNGNVPPFYVEGGRIAEVGTTRPFVLVMMRVNGAGQRA